MRQITNSCCQGLRVGECDYKGIDWGVWGDDVTVLSPDFGSGYMNL